MKNNKQIYDEIEYESKIFFIENIIARLTYPLDSEIQSLFEDKFRSLKESDKENIFFRSFEEQTDRDSPYDMGWFSFFAKELCIKETYNSPLESNKSSKFFDKIFGNYYQQPRASIQIIDWIIDNIPQMEDEHKELILGVLMDLHYEHGSSEQKYYDPLIYKAFKSGFFKSFEDILIKEFINRKTYNSNKDSFFKIDFFSKQIKQYEGFDQILFKDCAANSIIQAHIELYLYIPKVHNHKNEKDFESLNLEPGYQMSPSKGHLAFIALNELIEFLEKHNPQYLYNLSNQNNYEFKSILLFQSFIIEHRMQLSSNQNNHNLQYPKTEQLIDMCNLSESKSELINAFTEKFNIINETIYSEDRFKKIKLMIEQTIALSNSKEKKAKLKI